MHVLVDGLRLDTPAPSLACALAAARSHAQRQDRLVVDAHLDGRPIADEILSSPPTLPADGELACTTADRGEVVQGALLGVADLLGEAKHDHHATADLLAVGKLEDALARLPVTLTTWETVRQSVGDAAAILGIDPSGPPLAEPIARLTAALAELKRCVHARDWAGLGDVIGSDLAVQADQWRSTIGDLARDASARRVTSRYAAPRAVSVTTES